MPPKTILFKDLVYDNSVNYLEESETYTFFCPHCKGEIIVSKCDIKCKIFRHAVLKKTGKPIKPHTNKHLCEQLSKQDKIFGCGKPFRFDGNTVEVCDYI